MYPIALQFDSLSWTSKLVGNSSNILTSSPVFCPEGDEVRKEGTKGGRYEGNGNLNRGRERGNSGGG